MTKALIIVFILFTAILIYCNTGNNVSIPVDYIAVGDSITKRTFDTLNKTVFNAINIHGVDKAIDICNLNAMALTTTYGRDDITVGRTSLKVRNKANSPSPNDLVQLEFFSKLAEKGEPLNSKLVAEQSGIVHYYKPIILQPQCLSCHGKPGVEINDQTMKAIQAKYPDDNAIEYATGDLRGLWHITFRDNLQKN